MPTCRVNWRDKGGVEHGVRVEAVNRFQAFGLAMHQMQKCSWCNPGYQGLIKMIVQVEEGPLKGKRFVVTRDEFEAWVSEKPDLLLDRHRQYVLMLLGRMPPDREFINGRKAR